VKEFIAALELSSNTRLHPGFMYCLQYNGHLLVWFHEHHVMEGTAVVSFTVFWDVMP